MKSRRLQPKRYQLKKEAVKIVESGHPWIFRKHLSSATESFTGGQWLQLVNAENQIAGYGIYDKEGLIAIRVIKIGATPPSQKWIHERVDKALSRRENLRKYTNAFRAIHGENDGLPGIVIDVYDHTAVLQTYSKGVDALGRYIASIVAKKLELKNIVWKIPTKRKSERPMEGARVLLGKMPERIKFREGKMEMTVEVKEGQKSGLFLDLRALRKWLSQAPLAGKRVLNLFSYSGTLGLAAETGGAKEIWNVDISQGALDAAKAFHAVKKEKHRFIKADVFEWFRQLDENQKFDVIIVDPPMMASEMSQVPKAIQAYRNLYKSSLRHLAPKGQVIACCCTSRIPRAMFEQEVSKILSHTLKMKRSLAAEDDHHVAFPEGDYLKVLVWG